MELLLSSSMSPGDVNKQFQKHFPFLKLHFYSSDCLPNQKSAFYGPFNSITRLNKVVGNFLPTVIEFNRSDSVEEFEQRLKKQMGLFVSVLRKINEDWTDTGQTKYLSLDTQNSLGSVKFHTHYNDHTLFL